MPHVTTTLNQLAQLVGGRLLCPSAGAELPINGAAALADVGEGQITLIDSIERTDSLSETTASAAIVPEGALATALPAIAVADVHQAFSAIIHHFRPSRTGSKIGISPTALVSPSAKIADDVEIHHGATIGDDVEIAAGSTIHAGVHVMAGCKIGQDVTLFPGVTLYQETVIGDRSIIHASATLGAYGFGYRLVEGRHTLASQLGHAELGADVEVGANSTIDRGTYGPTIIGEGTKIDNLVMIAHNCRIGRHNMICSQVGIAGSTTTGDYVVIAGQVGVRDHVHIGDQATLGAMAGIINDVPAGGTYIGIPATPEREQKIKQASFSKLPEMRRQLKALHRTVDKIAVEVERIGSQPAADQQPGTSAKRRPSAA